jgi:hypothetical protein
MDLLAESRKDIQIITQAEWSTDLNITPKVGSPVNVKGLASKHHFLIDPETGTPINSKNVHCSVSEQVLVDAGYPVRNGNNEVHMVGDKVAYTDSAGVLASYFVQETMPDETLGLIVMTLASFL